MSDTRESIDRLLVEHRSLEDQIKTEDATLSGLRADAEAIDSAQTILQHVAQATQQQAHTKISSVVSRCLETVFDDPYEFRIEFERKRGKTEARLVFVRDDLELDPLTASGGGVIDVAAFALRLSCLLLVRPPLRKVVFLDEPFRFLSAEYVPRVKALLEALSEEMEVQFIMVTHIDGLRCGKVIEL